MGVDDQYAHLFGRRPYAEKSVIVLGSMEARR
jgi:hypothetical protein